MKQQISHEHIDQLANLARMAGAQASISSNELDSDKYSRDDRAESGHDEHESTAQRLIHHLMTSFKV